MALVSTGEQRALGIYRRDASHSLTLQGLVPGGFAFVEWTSSGVLAMDEDEKAVHRLHLYDVNGAQLDSLDVCIELC